MTTYTHRIEVSYAEYQILREAFEQFCGHCLICINNEKLSEPEQRSWEIKKRVVEEAGERLFRNRHTASSYYPILEQENVRYLSPGDFLNGEDAS